jgi:Ser/Thr protein kinase RdoA (MazF antagonist)
MPDPNLLDTIASHLAVQPSSLTVLAHRAGRVICTADTAHGHVVAKASTTPHEFDREAAAMHLLAGAGLPVSQVMTVVGGPPAILVARWAEGEPVNANTAPVVLASVGQLLARIHRLPATGPFSGGHATITGWVTTWIRDVVRWWSVRDNAPPSAIERTNRWIDEIRPTLDARSGTTILFDGRPEHFLLDHRGAVHMIDVADLMPGDSLMDLAVFELHAPGTLDHLFAGYEPSSTEHTAADTLIPFYRYLFHVAGAEWMLRNAHHLEATNWHLDRARFLLDQSAPTT